MDLLYAAYPTSRRAAIRGLGLLSIDEDKACSGYMLFTPQFGDGEPLLIDLRGEVVHR